MTPSRTITIEPTPPQSLALSGVGPDAERLARDHARMKRAAAGDEAAVNQLVDEHAGAIIAWLRPRVPDQELAEQIAFDVFLPQRLARYAGESKARTYLIGVAKNLMLHALRSARRERERLGVVRSIDLLREGHGFDLADPRVVETTRVVAQELARRVYGALDEREAELLRLRYEEGCSFAEIGERLAIDSLDTVRSLHRRTLQKAREGWTGAANPLE